MTEPLLTVLTRLARREATALTLIPDLRLQVDNPEPAMRFTVVDCPCCPHAAPLPLREVATGTGQRGGALPVLDVLRCEDIPARSLVPLSLVQVAAGPPQRFVSRAAFWARTGADWSTGAGIRRGLELLDAAERWFDSALPAMRTVESGPANRVLPMSTRVAGAARTAEEVAASRGSLHFVTAHLSGADVDRLNAAYLAARSAAVRERLRSRAGSGPDVGGRADQAF